MVDKKCPYARGRGVGGSSLINGLMYVRGNHHDFDRLENEGLRGWSYKDVLPLFIKSEDTYIFNAEPGYHGHSGPLTVEYHNPYSPQMYKFIQANNELGNKFVDYNGKSQLGVSFSQLNNIKGRRDDTGKAFVKPVLNRTNLVVKTESFVTKILFNGTNTEGVVFSNNGQLYRALASKEVIVSAGSLQSPHILQLSGIGKAEDLSRHNIPLVKNLTVGENLWDHATFYGLTLTMDFEEPILSLTDYVKEYLSGEGPFAVAGNNQGLSYWRTNFSTNPEVPNLEIMIVPSNGTSPYTQKGFFFTNETYDNLYGYLNDAKFFKIYVILLYPKSRGSVKLKSSSPYEYPVIDSRFLEHPDDIYQMYQGVNIVKKLINTRAFQEVGIQLHLPHLPACKNYTLDSKPYWYCLIRQVTMNVYHPMGTCKMGLNSSKDAVVDERLRVHGIKGLRVADGSVYPNPIAAHPNAPIIMVGEKASNMIKEDYGKSTGN